MAQVVECLPNKCDALSSNSSIDTHKEKQKQTKEYIFDIEL
jgi:hypothetical protein